MSVSSARLLRGVTGVLVLVLVGCGGPVDRAPSVEPSSTVSASPSSTPSVSNSPVPSPSVVPVVVSETVVCPSDGPVVDAFTGPAVEVFGAGGVMDAYCEWAAFFVQRGVTDVTDPARGDVGDASRDLGFVGDRLTVRALARWEAAAAGAAGSAVAERSLSELTFYRLGLPSGWGYPSGGPVSVGGVVSPASADVVRLGDGRKALALWFSVESRLPVVRASVGGGVESASDALGLVREVALYVVPNPDVGASGDVSWLLESWTTSWDVLGVKAWGAGR